MSSPFAQNFHFVQLAAKPFNGINPDHLFITFILLFDLKIQKTKFPVPWMARRDTNFEGENCRITFWLYTTFGRAYKGLRSKTARPNVAEKNPTKGGSPAGVFRSPKRFRRFAYTDLLGDVPACYHF
jgi:hypothetical protein